MENTSDEAAVALRLIQHQCDALRNVVQEFPEDRLWQRPLPRMVSLGNLVCHVAGSMQDWLRNALMQEGWQRDRAGEFQRTGGMNRAALLAHLDEAWSRCEPAWVCLRRLEPEGWQQTRTFRDRQYTVREIVWHQVAHVAYHAGQAAFLRRLVAGLPPRP